MAIPLEIGRSALLVVDAQRDIVDEDGALARNGARGLSQEDADQIVGQTQNLVAAFRAAGRPVVFITTAFRPDYADCAIPDALLARWRQGDASAFVEGSRGAELAAGLQPKAADYVVTKK